MVFLDRKASIVDLFGASAGYFGRLVSGGNEFYNIVNIRNNYDSDN